MTRLTTLLLAIALTLPFAARAAKPEGKSGLYMFGMTTNFNDSTVCLTSVALVQGAALDKKTHFLPGCSLYGNQLKEYVESTRGGLQTPVVFYSEKRGTVEKKYLKVRKRLKAAGWHYTELPAGDFAFQPVTRKGAPAEDGEQN